MKRRRPAAVDEVLLRQYLKTLKLPSILAEYEATARQCAEEGNDYLGFLLRLCERELADREVRATQRRLKSAGFPQLKTLDTFDFSAQPSINRALVLELQRCEFVAKRESVILLGGTGTGKTHVATGLGVAACQRGLKVRYYQLSELITQLLEMREERSLGRLRGQLARLDVLILDEFGYVQTSAAGGELLFDVLSRAYERTSVIVTTNLPFERWTEVLGNERLVAATLDRLTHRCHILEATGESYRLKEARQRQQGGNAKRAG
jgi:DNA replication protein DnaC